MTRARSGLAASVAAVTVAVLAFDLWSSQSSLARRGIGVGGNAAPPVYGRFLPSFSWFGAIAILLAASAAFGAVLFLRRSRIRPGVFLAIAVGFMVAFSFVVAGSDQDADKLVFPVKRTDPPDYAADVPLVNTLGIPTFIRSYPDLIQSEVTRSLHVESHPPGPLILLTLVNRAFPDTYVPRALVLVLLSSLVLVPAWVIARRVAGERAAAIAVMLLAVAPSPVMFGWVSLDAVLATVMVAGIAAVVVGLGPGASARASFLAGASVGLAAFFNYAASFLVLFGVLYAFLTRPAREAARALALAAAGGLGVLGILWISLGYDPIRSYSAGYEALIALPSTRPHSYWLFGNVFAWLTFAGMPIAALALRELVQRRPRYLLAFLVPVAVFYVLPKSVTHIIPGETERTLNYAFAVGATAAAAWLVRWEGSARRPRVLGALVAITALQTIVLEALYRLPW